MAEVVHVHAPTFVQAGHTVADALERAAQQGPVPAANGGTSPADAAADALAGAMQVQVATASAELAPRGPKIREASQAAAEGLTAKDEQNAALLQSIPATMAQSATAAGGSGAPTPPVLGTVGTQGQIQMVSDGWDDPRQPFTFGPDWWEDEDGGYHHGVETPIQPGGGAAAGGGGHGRAPV